LAAPKTSASSSPSATALAVISGGAGWSFFGMYVLECTNRLVYRGRDGRPAVTGIPARWFLVVRGEYDKRDAALGKNRFGGSLSGNRGRRRAGEVQSGHSPHHVGYVLPVPRPGQTRSHGRDAAGHSRRSAEADVIRR